MDGVVGLRLFGLCFGSCRKGGGLLFRAGGGEDGECEDGGEDVFHGLLIGIEESFSGFEKSDDHEGGVE